MHRIHTDATLRACSGAAELGHGVQVAFLADDVLQAPALRHDDLDDQIAATLEAYYAPLAAAKMRAVTSSAG